MRKLILLAGIIATPALSDDFPDYDIKQACDAGAAQAISEGMESASAMVMGILCRSMAEQARDIAAILWDKSSESAREKCAVEVADFARIKGVSTGWYPALLECLRGTGKKARLR